LKRGDVKRGSKSRRDMKRGLKRRGDMKRKSKRRGDMKRKSKEKRWYILPSPFFFFLSSFLSFSLVPCMGKGYV
jgi:hypothetical protein